MLISKFLGNNFNSYLPIKLSNFPMPTSFSHPLRQHFAPPVKRPFIKTAPADISCKGTKSCCKGLPLFQSQYKSLVMLNLELMCDFKSKTIPCGAKVKECDFPVTSITKIDVTNLFDLNTIPKQKPG